MILNDDESDEACAGDKAEGAIVDVDTGHIGRDASPYNTFTTSELASGPAKSIDTSGPWYDVEGGRYIEWPCEQQGVPSAPAQDQPQTVPQSSKPLQDQTNQQGVSNITQSLSVESALTSSTNGLFRMKSGL